MEPYIGRQHGSGLSQLFIYFLAKGHDVIPGHHFHVQDQTGCSVKLDVLFGLLIAPFDRRNVFEAYGSTGSRIGPDDLFLQFVFRLIGDHHLQRTASIIVASYGAQPLQGYLCFENRRTDAVGR